jgi:hypothetical protein
MVITSTTPKPHRLGAAAPTPTGTVAAVATTPSVLALAVRPMIKCAGMTTRAMQNIMCKWLFHLWI